MSWLAVWDGRILIHRDRKARTADLSQGVVRFEMSLRNPLQVTEILWQGRTGTARDLRILARPNGTVSVEHGPFLFDTGPGFLFSGEPLSFHYCWDSAGRADHLVLRNIETGAEFQTRLGAQAPRDLAEIVPETPSTALSVSFAGVANHVLPDTPLPGLSGDTLIDTPNGPVQVKDLTVGTRVRTQKGEQTLRWISSSEQLARGSTAPVLLRAPYHGLTHDILVTGNQHILMSGCEVEYLFGAEEVLANIGDIRRAPSAQLNLTSPVMRAWHLMLDDHDCVLSGRCALDTVLLADVMEARGKPTEALAASDRQPAWPVIDRPSAQALLDMLTHNRHAAA